jgi:NAD(P)-dependent dehydrogenase (short-subunit alcohol dehydrogenase family)
MKQDSVKAFAEAINNRPGSLDILVNNAGLGYTKKSFTEQGVGMLTQVRATLCCVVYVQKYVMFV